MGKKRGGDSVLETSQKREGVYIFPTKMALERLVSVKIGDIPIFRTLPPYFTNPGR